MPKGFVIKTCEYFAEACMQFVLLQMKQFAIRWGISGTVCSYTIVIYALLYQVANRCDYRSIIYSYNLQQIVYFWFYSNNNFIKWISKIKLRMI